MLSTGRRHQRVRSIFAAGAVERVRKTFEALRKGIIKTHGLLVQTFVFVWVRVS